MAKKYNPQKALHKIWRLCENPLKLIITHESKNGRYVLTDSTKLYGRILDLNETAIFAGTYIVNILKFGGPWHSFAGDQNIKKDLLLKIKTIWYTDKSSKEFKLEDYLSKE